MSGYILPEVFHILDLSEGLSKLIPIDEQPNHQIVHLFRLGKHPLEGSCQEAILPRAQLLTTFLCCVPSGTPRSHLVTVDASLFGVGW